MSFPAKLSTDLSALDKSVGRRRGGYVRCQPVVMVYDQGAGFVRVRYRSGTGDVVETTLERVDVGEVVAGLPVGELRWVKGQRHYSGWYWSSTTGGLVVYESRLEM